MRYRITVPKCVFPNCVPKIRSQTAFQTTFPKCAPELRSRNAKFGVLRCCFVEDSKENVHGLRCITLVQSYSVLNVCVACPFDNLSIAFAVRHEFVSCLFACHSDSTWEKHCAIN